MIQSVTTDTAAMPRELNALDRCDLCGAQAYIRAVLATGELLFCAHHAREHEMKLKPVSSLWQDESHKLA